MNKFDDMLGMLHKMHGEDFRQVIAMDKSGDCLNRAWVVAEIAKCQRSGITQHAVVHFPVHLAGSAVKDKIDGIDVEKCEARVEQDKIDILAKIDNKPVYNTMVRQTVRGLVLPPHTEGGYAIYAIWVALGLVGFCVYSAISSADATFLLVAGFGGSFLVGVAPLLALMLYNRRCEQTYSFLLPSLDVSAAWFTALEREVPLEGAPGWCTPWLERAVVPARGTGLHQRWSKWLPPKAATECSHWDLLKLLIVQVAVIVMVLLVSGCLGVMSYGSFAGWLFGDSFPALGWLCAAMSAVILTMLLLDSDSLIRQRLRRACGGPNSLPTATADIEQSLLPPVVQAVGPGAHGEDSF